MAGLLVLAAEDTIEFKEDIHELFVEVDSIFCQLLACLGILRCVQDTLFVLINVWGDLLRQLVRGTLHLRQYRVPLLFFLLTRTRTYMDTVSPQPHSNLIPLFFFSFFCFLYKI